MAATMKAVVFAGTRGKPTEVLSVKTVPKPTPNPGHVLVRVLLTPLHPSTIAGITPGPYPGPAAGGILSSEGVGIIESHGADTAGAPPVGTRVLLMGSVGGTFAEYTQVPAAALLPVPDAVSNENAAQFVVNPLAAYLLVHSKHGTCPEPGEFLLQTAASSVLGKNVIQLSKHFGFKTINVVRNPKQVEELVALGADVVICTATEDVQQRVNAVTGGKGVKYAIDPVGGDATSAVIQSMAYCGKLSVYGQLAKEEIHFPSGLLVVKLLTLAGFWLSDWFKVAELEEKNKFWERSWDYL